MKKFEGARSGLFICLIGALLLVSAAAMFGVAVLRKAGVVVLAQTVVCPIRYLLAIAVATGLLAILLCALGVMVRSMHKTAYYSQQTTIELEKFNLELGAMRKLQSVAVTELRRITGSTGDAPEA